MADSRFREAVILLTHHAHNSLGLVLNRPLPNTLREITDKLDLEIDQDWPLYWGGPVATSTVWLLHDRGWQHPASIPVDRNWSVLSHVSMFQQFVESSLPLDFRIFMGCSSWAPEQLRAELEGEPPWSQRNSWLILEEPDTDLVLDPDPEGQWTRAIEQSVKVAAQQCL